MGGEETVRIAEEKTGRTLVWGKKHEGHWGVALPIRDCGDYIKRDHKQRKGNIVGPLGNEGNVLTKTGGEKRDSAGMG